MMAVSLNWGKIGKLLSSVCFVFVFNEFLIYYLVLLQCTWPTLNLKTADFSTLPSQHEPLRVMILADTHLLGNRDGHWFDKLRREWQMERAFQTSMMVHNPEVVFVLGDLLDEGKWSNGVEFQSYVANFRKMFRHPQDSELHVVVGNHDIGFHYMVDENKRRRFNNAFDTEAVRLLTIRDVNFLLVNSVALEGDNCNMCHEAMQQLATIKKKLNCAQGKATQHSCDKSETVPPTKPILLQHYPMFRESDHECTGPDTAPPSEKDLRFREKWDCISEKASRHLFSSIHPRLIVSGHTHYGCYRDHPDGTPEWTIPSFNWRNINNPSFLLAVISNNNFAVKKCYMPKETTVKTLYFIGGASILIWLLFPRSWLSSVNSKRTIKDT